jgi:predicted ATPase
VLLSQGDEDGAEASLLRALDVAREQHARSWELRTAIALSRLWQSQGKSAQAHALLSTVYRTFTEGFSTPDLVEAKHLLHELQRDLPTIAT